MNNKRAAIAAMYILMAIILGAFGAHALKDILTPERLISFETGVRYQMYIGIALLILSLNEDRIKFNIKWTWILLNVGINLFSGSIYLLAMQDILQVNLKFLGPITPIGGACFILAWMIFIFHLLKKGRASS
jgi:uncharacterized membrane protein YgdD (TMEM256/DUF423 family)